MTSYLTTLGTGLVTSVAFFCVAGVVPAASAAPDTNRCVSKAEYRKVKPDMRMSRVKRIVDGQKYLTFSGPDRRQYDACFSKSGGIDCMIVNTKTGGTRVKSKRIDMCQNLFEA